MNQEQAHGTSKAVAKETDRRGVLLLALLALIMGLCGSWIDRPSVRHRAKGPSAGPMLQVEVQGPALLEGFYEVPPGTTAGTFLRDIGGGRMDGNRAADLDGRPLEDLTAIVFGDEAGNSLLDVRQMSPAKAFLLGAPLDLNRASVWDLTLLPGVGPVLARRIVEDRRSRGPFASPGDLGRVRGMPRKLVEAIQPVVSASGKDTSH